MKKNKKNHLVYEYLVMRKRDGKMFFMYGDLKNKKAGFGPGCLFEAVGDDYFGYKIKPKIFNEGFDGLYVKNISCEEKYNSKKFCVLYQKSYDYMDITRHEFEMFSSAS